MDLYLVFKWMNDDLWLEVLKFASIKQIFGFRSVQKELNRCIKTTEFVALHTLAVLPQNKPHHIVFVNGHRGEFIDMLDELIVTPELLTRGNFLNFHVIFRPFLTWIAKAVPTAWLG